MALSNAITGVNTTFVDGVGDWLVTDAAAGRDLNRSFYTNAVLHNSDTALVRENSAKVVANSFTAPTFSLESIPVTGGVTVQASCRVASGLITSSYARLDITFYNAFGTQTGTVSSGDAVSTSAQSSVLTWSLLMNVAVAPEDAVSATMTLTFGRNAAGNVITGAVASDYWLVASPGLVSFTNFDWFTYNAYQNLPGYIIQSDLDALYIRRFLIMLFKGASEIRELAKSFRHDRAEEGVEHLPLLADPANMPTAYFSWLASLLGVNLGASASSAGSNWSTLYTLADTDAGDPHLGDGVANDGLVTWAEWNREFGNLAQGSASFTQADDTWTTATPHGLDVGDSLKFNVSNGGPSEYNLGDRYYVVSVGSSTTFQLSEDPPSDGGVVLAGTSDSTAGWDYQALDSFQWSQIVDAASGSFDGVAAARLLLKYAASGIHAGKLSNMDSFLREFIDPAYELFLKPLEYSSPFFTKLIADSRDVTDGGLVLQNFLDLISPAGTSTVVSASFTPMKEAAAFAFLSDYYGQPAGTFGPQGVVNEAGGAVASALMSSQIDSLPILGGIIGPAPLGPGCALLSGHRVSLSTSDAANAVGGSGAENFDIIIGVSLVSLPSSGARTVASGGNWALKLESTGAGTFDWGANTHTSTATYDFDNKSKVAVQYIRVNKVDTTLKLFVQDSLFSDWEENQLGDDLTVAGTESGGSNDFVLLSDADPSSDAELASLSCALHRALLYTAATGTAAWSESDGEYYDYGNAVIDANLRDLSSTEYYATSITLSNDVFTITDSGGANLKNGSPNDLVIANDGTYDYVNISNQELAVYDDDPLFVHDEFSFTAVVKDPVSVASKAVELLKYSHEDIGTVFRMEVVDDSSTPKISVSLSDGDVVPNVLEPTDIDTSGWAAGEWHTVTATYSPANGLRLYADGVLSDTDASTDLLFVDISQNGGGLLLDSNVKIGGITGTGASVSPFPGADCRYVAFHQFEMNVDQVLCLATELGTV